MGIARTTVSILAFAVLVGVTSAAPSVDASPACPQALFASCYSKSNMTIYAKTAVAEVNSFVDSVLPGSAVRPTRVEIVTARQRVNDGCESLTRDGLADSYAYFYCPADNGIYLGVDQLWNFYREHGEMAPLIGIAHEYGHLLQHRARVPEPETYEQSIALENQADCVAGAFARFLKRGGELEPGDVKDLAEFFRSIGSAESPFRDHGTADERVRAFTRGYRADLAACSIYVPGYALF